MITAFIDGNSTLEHQVCDETWSHEKGERIKEFVNLGGYVRTGEDRYRVAHTIV